LKRAFQDQDARTDAGIALESAKDMTAVLPPALPDSEVGLAARAWLPPELLALVADRAERDLISSLTPRFWDDALAGNTLSTVVDVLRTEPAAKEGDVLLSHNSCLPQRGASRAEVRRQLGKPFGSERQSDSFVAVGAEPGIRVAYEKHAVYRVLISHPAEVRAAGCDAPALRYLEVPRWQRAWEYGATSEEIASYGMPDAHFDSVVWVLDGALSLTEL